VGYSKLAGAPKTAAKSVTPIFYWRSLIMITKGQIQVCIRLKAEVG